MLGRLQTLLSIMALLALQCAGAVSDASAHATLSRSEPGEGAILDKAPDRLRLRFSESVSHRFSSATLLDINSRPVEITGIRADPNDPNVLIVSLPKLPEGVYSLLWKTLSDVDGHLSRGFLVFGFGAEAQASAVVGEQSEAAPPWPEVLLRWLNYGLVLSMVGALIVVRGVLIPAISGRARADFVRRALRRAVRRILRCVVVCAGLGFLVNLGLLAWQADIVAATMTGDAPLPAVAASILGETRWGVLWLTRQAVVLVLGGVVLAVIAQACRAARARSAAFGRDSAWAVASALSAMLVTAQALVGHAGARADDGALAVAADALHLLAASVWVGGMLALAAGLVPGTKRLGRDAAGIMRAGWAPFSRLAAISVGLLFATGLYNVARQVPTVEGLLATLYGQTLLVKVGLMLAMGAIGLVNSILLHPNIVAAPLARILQRPIGWAPLPLHRLPLLILCESGLALVVLLATGLITASPTPNEAQLAKAREAGLGQMNQSVDDLLITLSASPNRPGQNVFTVFAASAQRPARADIIRVILRFTYLDKDLGRSSAVAKAIEPGRYLLGGRYLGMAGRWRIDVVVRRAGVEDSVARFDWTVAVPVATGTAGISRAPLGPVLSKAAGGILVGFAVLILVIQIGPGIRRRRGRVTAPIRVPVAPPPGDRPQPLPACLAANVATEGPDIARGRGFDEYFVRRKSLRRVKQRETLHNGNRESAT